MSCIKNTSYRKLTKYGVFSSIIFFSLFIFCNFSNAYFSIPGNIIEIDESGTIGGYHPAFDTRPTRPVVPGDYITPWGFSPNLENRLFLATAGWFGPGGINYLYGGYGGGLYGGYYGNSSYGGYGGRLW